MLAASILAFLETFFTTRAYPGSSAVQVEPLLPSWHLQKCFFSAWCSVSVVAPETLCAVVTSDFLITLLEPSTVITQHLFWLHCPSAALFVVAHWFSLGKASELFIVSANLFTISVPWESPGALLHSRFLPLQSKSFSGLVP